MSTDPTYYHPNGVAPVRVRPCVNHLALTPVQEAMIPMRYPPAVPRIGRARPRAKVEVAEPIAEELPTREVEQATNWISHQ